MNGLLTILATLQGGLRTALLLAAVLAAAVATLDWMVRTRRLSPFGPVARFFRKNVDPLLVPVERRIVRAGGLPASAPWWGLAAVVIGGILLLAALDFLTGFVASLARGLSTGPRGLATLGVTWAIGILQIAILVCVIASWLPGIRYSPWVRWAFALSEPILRRLRRFIPPFGSIDVTPIVAFFLLSIVQRLVLAAIR